MQTYDVKITGTTPLLMHWDNLDWADEMSAWKENPENKKFSKAGDDRTPAWRWFGCLYNDGTHVSIPSDNLMRCLMEGGTMVLVPGGKSGKTFKSQSQSGLMITSPFWPLIGSKGLIEIEALQPLLTETDYPTHCAEVRKYGMTLFAKRARIGQSKHIRVRPRFEEWSISGQILVTDDQITTEVLKLIFDAAGRYKGLGDWRPSSKTPGSYGMFKTEIAEAK